MSTSIESYQFFDPTHMETWNSYTQLLIMKTHIGPAYRVHNNGSPNSIYNYGNNYIFIIHVTVMNIKYLKNYRLQPCFPFF